MTFYNTHKNESDFVFFFLKYFTSELILNQHCTWGIEVKQSMVNEASLVEDKTSI